MIPDGRTQPALLPLNDVRELLRWYRLTLCEAEIRDPRGWRVRFLPENFIHLVKLTTKYGTDLRMQALPSKRLNEAESSWWQGGSMRNARPNCHGYTPSQLPRGELCPIGRHWVEGMKHTFVILARRMRRIIAF
jgi:hypothetical protein